MVAYSAYDRTRYEEERVIDLGVYWNIPDLRERDIHDIWHLLHNMQSPSTASIKR